MPTIARDSRRSKARFRIVGEDWFDDRAGVPHERYERARIDEPIPDQDPESKPRSGYRPAVAEQ